MSMKKFMSLKHVCATSVVALSFLRPSYAPGQALWEFAPHAAHYAAVGIRPSEFDSTGPGREAVISKLKQIMASDIVERYYAPAMLLAHHYGDTESQYLIDFLRISFGTDIGTRSHGPYFQYQFIRGLLGDAGAIPCLDTLVQAEPMTRIAFKAIYLLAEAGRFDYFQMLTDGLGNERFIESCIMGLGLYGTQAGFKDQVIDLLVNTITNEGVPQRHRTYALLHLSELNRPLAAQVLLDRFQHADEETMQILFETSSSVDPVLEPTLSIEGVPLTSQENLRRRFFPIYYSIKGDSVTPGWRSRKYLQPTFVKFCLDWIPREPSEVNVGLINKFLDEFLPLPPLESVTISEQYDELLSQLEEVFGYGWVGDEGFRGGLIAYLENSQRLYDSGDHKGAASVLAPFVKDIEGAYRKPDPPARFVTTEAYKFLYYNCQYILDRLEDLK